MDKIKPRTLSGFMELQPDKQVQMDKMRAVLAETYARYGGGRGAAGQGRRRDGKADLPLHEG